MIYVHMNMQRLGGAMVTHLPLTTMAQVQVLGAAWVRLCATCGMSFTLHSQCLLVFPSEGVKIVLILIGAVSKAKDGLARHCSRGHKTQVCINY